MITLSLRKMLFNYISLLFCFILISLAGCSEKPRPNIRINGSTTVHPIMKSVSAAYMQKKGINIVQRSEGSKKGISSLINAQCDIATSSSKITPSLRREAESKQLHLKEFVFAYDMIVPIIHPSNSVQNLSLDQLKAIFNGSIKAWSDAGGTSENILVVHRNRSSGTREVWEKRVHKSKDAPEGHVVLQSNSEVLAYVATHPSAIGYISFGYVNHDIKMISVNGIDPPFESVGYQKYPFYRSLYLYVAEENFSYEIKSFIIFLLCREGQEIVKKSGFFPLYPFSFE